MASDGEIFDSPTGWVNQHITQYVESGGKRGQRFQGNDTLLLTTRGRRSGKLRRTALIYGEDAGRYLVVASNGGSAGHPAWYLNLAADPDVTVQVGPEIFPARARAATDAERPALWGLMAKIFPTYDTFQAKTARTIPVVILERA
jgi:deazaflavin-dependent oxidoreductase (nitroreductase family)